MPPKHASHARTAGCCPIRTGLRCRHVPGGGSRALHKRIVGTAIGLRVETRTRVGHLTVAAARIPSARSGIVAILLLALAWASGAGATTPDNPDDTAAKAQAAAEQAVREHFGMPGDRIEVAAVPINSRLRLEACGLPLRASVAERAKPVSLVTAQVQCPQAGGWSIRVAVHMQLFRDVLVSTRPLLRGDGLRAADVRVEQRDVTHLGYGYIDSIERVAGRTLSRALRTNSVLTPNALGGRQMVRAGDRVEVIARLGGIVVRANGVALGSGDSGSRLRVRNVDSGKIVDGIIKAPGQVIALP